MEKHYGRAQFLRDALSLGLPAPHAFSRVALRRRRDRLMREHHPDRGGSDETARQINEIYARMLKWLAESYRPHARRVDNAPNDVSAVEETTSASTKRRRSIRKAAATTLWIATLMASSYIAAQKFRRR